MRIHVTAPGKVLIAGGYAVLEPPKGTGTVVPTPNARAHVHIHFQKALTWEISLHSSFHHMTVNQSTVPADIALHSIGMVLSYAGIPFEHSHVYTPWLSTLSPPPSTPISHAWHMDLTIATDDAFHTQSGKGKSGLGASAAICVSTISAMLHTLGMIELPSNVPGVRLEQGGDPALPCDGTLALIYALGLGAHRIAQGGVGSGFDISAAVIGFPHAYMAPCDNPMVPHAKGGRIVNLGLCFKDGMTQYVRVWDLAFLNLVCIDISGERTETQSDTPKMVQMHGKVETVKRDMVALSRHIAMCMDMLEISYCAMQHAPEPGSFVQVLTLFAQQCFFPEAEQLVKRWQDPEEWIPMPSTVSSIHSFMKYMASTKDTEWQRVQQWQATYPHIFTIQIFAYFLCEFKDALAQWQQALIVLDGMRQTHGRPAIVVPPFHWHIQNTKDQLGSLGVGIPGAGGWDALFELGLEGGLWLDRYTNHSHPIAHSRPWR